MGAIVLKLSEGKTIRGKKLLPGSVLFSGDCAVGISPDDLNKAIQLHQVTVEIPKKKEVEKKDK